MLTSGKKEVGGGRARGVVEGERWHLDSPAAAHGPCPSGSGLLATNWLPSLPPDFAPAACWLWRRTPDWTMPATSRQSLGTARRCGVQPETAAGTATEGSAGEEERGNRCTQTGRARDHLDFTGRGRMLEGQLFPVEHASVLTVGRAERCHPIRQQYASSQWMQQLVQSSMYQGSARMMIYEYKTTLTGKDNSVL